MSLPCIWFNQHLSSSSEILQAIARMRAHHEFRLIFSHSSERFPARVHGDFFAKEPYWLADEDYVQFALDFAKRHGVTHFYPGRKAIPLAQASDKFSHLGVQMISVANGPTLHLLQSKISQYEHLKSSSIPLPGYARINCLADLRPAYHHLRLRYPVVCYKPSVSMFGHGFKIVVEEELPRADDPWRISLAGAIQELHAMPTFPELILMGFLPGLERSVDCLAHEGKLLRSILRVKNPEYPRRQHVEGNLEIEDYARQIAEHFHLNAVFNVQFRDDEKGRSYLLEINPRMSGGLVFTLQTGITLPYWAIRLTLGTMAPTRVPYPRKGIDVDVLPRLGYSG